MHSGLTPYCVDWTIRQQQVKVSPEDALAAEEQSNTTFSNLNMLNTCISLIKCVHCPLSICGFSGMFFCGALANFLETVVLVSISLLYLHVAYGIRVYINPSIH